MKKNEKVTLVINLTRNQINRSIRCACELSGENNGYSISDKAWSKLIEQPVEVDVDDCHSLIGDEGAKISMATLSVYALNSIYDEVEDEIEEQSEEDMINNAREILAKAENLINKKINNKKSNK